MRSFFAFMLPVASLLVVNAQFYGPLDNITLDLGSRLSSGSLITRNTSAYPRWSEFGAPQPQFFVRVNAEEDISTAIKYCNEKNITFVVQSGGNGWSDTFHLGQDGITIDIGGLTNISIHSDKHSAKIQAGTLTQSMVEIGYANDIRFANPSCNCVSYLGCVLGGGLVRTSGLYGWGVDQLISVNLVLASGEMITLSDHEGDPDLWWAIRGAGPNFGVVASATVHAYPILAADNVASIATFVFNQSQLPDLIAMLNDLQLTPEAEVDLVFATTGPPGYVPAVLATPIYFGANASAANEELFAPFLKLGPLSQNISIVPYTEWNAGGDAFCIKGDRKPSYVVSGTKFDPKTYSAVFDEFSAFIGKYGGDQVGQSSLLIEKFPTQAAITIGEKRPASYPFRALDTQTAIMLWYPNASLDAAANAFGANVRQMLQATAGVANKSAYINYAHGDEDLSEIYGTSLDRLRPIKRKYDPYGHFDQWFPIR